MLTDGLEWCGLLFCFYQLFGLSFWRHPFTAEHPLLRHWCSATFLRKIISVTDVFEMTSVDLSGHLDLSAFSLIADDDEDGGVFSSEDVSALSKHQNTFKKRVNEFYLHIFSPPLTSHIIPSWRSVWRRRDDHDRGPEGWFRDLRHSNTTCDLKYGTKGWRGCIIYTEDCLISVTCVSEMHRSVSVFSGRR